VDPTLAVKSVEAAFRFTWDLPYKFLASIGAITTGICWRTKEADRPLNVLTQAFRWAGFDITTRANEVNDWLTAPSRLNIIAVTALSVLYVSLLPTVAWAYRYKVPETTRSAATVLLAGTILAQLYGPPDLLNWYSLLGLALLASSLVYSSKRQWKWHVTVGFSILNLVLSAVYAVSVPLSWGTARH